MHGALCPVRDSTVFPNYFICKLFSWIESESRSVVSSSLWPHGLSVLGVLWARILEWVAFPFSRGSFPTQRSNPGLPHCRWILYQLSQKGSPRILEWLAFPFSMGSSQSRKSNWGLLYCRRIPYNWAIREAHRWIKCPYKNNVLSTVWMAPDYDSLDVANKIGII